MSEALVSVVELSDEIDTEAHHSLAKNQRSIVDEAKSQGYLLTVHTSRYHRDRHRATNPEDCAQSTEQAYSNNRTENIAIRTQYHQNLSIPSLALRSAACAGADTKPPSHPAIPTTALQS